MCTFFLLKWKTRKMEAIQRELHIWNEWINQLCYSLLINTMTDGSGDHFGDECPTLEFCWSLLFGSPPSPTNHAQRPCKHAHVATAERQTCETFGRLIAHTFSEAPSTLRPASCQAKVSTNLKLPPTLWCNILFLFILLFVF